MPSEVAEKVPPPVKERSSAAKAGLIRQALRHEWNSCPSRSCMNPVFFRSPRVNFLRAVVPKRELQVCLGGEFSYKRLATSGAVVDTSLVGAWCNGNTAVCRSGRCGLESRRVHSPLSRAQVHPRGERGD